MEIVTDKDYRVSDAKMAKIMLGEIVGVELLEAGLDCIRVFRKNTESAGDRGDWLRMMEYSEKADRHMRDLGERIYLAIKESDDV